jgi:hypothetical protein
MQPRATSTVAVVDRFHERKNGPVGTVRILCLEDRLRTVAFKGGTKKPSRFDTSSRNFRLPVCAFKLDKLMYCLFRLADEKNVGKIQRAAGTARGPPR